MGNSGLEARYRPELSLGQLSQSLNPLVWRDRGWAGKLGHHLVGANPGVQPGLGAGTGEMQS